MEIVGSIKAREIKATGYWDSGIAIGSPIEWLTFLKLESIFLQKWCYVITAITHLAVGLLIANRARRWTTLEIVMNEAGGILGCYQSALLITDIS